MTWSALPFTCGPAARSRPLDDTTLPLLRALQRLYAATTSHPGTSTRSARQGSVLTMMTKLPSRLIEVRSFSTKRTVHPSTDFQSGGSPLNCGPFVTETGTAVLTRSCSRPMSSAQATALSSSAVSPDARTSLGGSSGTPPSAGRLWHPPTRRSSAATGTNPILTGELPTPIRHPRG
jgi:hypothetical protein